MWFLEQGLTSYKNNLDTMNHPLETLFIDSRSLKTLKIVAHENHIIMVPCMMNKIDILKIKSNRIVSFQYPNIFYKMISMGVFI